jgi:hypothetical protein
MGIFANQKVRRMIAVEGRKDKLPQIVNEALIIDGRILKLAGEAVKDEFGREYFGCKVEIEPGYDRYFYSADPVVTEKIRGLNPGDIVNVTGVLRRNGKGRGFHVRATEVVVKQKAEVAAAPAATVPVQA